jgi:hypothetical protein
MDFQYSSSDDDVGSDSDSSGDEFDTTQIVTSIVIFNHQAAYQAATVAHEIIFNNNVDIQGDFTVNQLLPSVPRLQNVMNAHKSIFQSWTGFTPCEWESLSQKVCPVLQDYGRNRRLKTCHGRRTKLSPQERLLSFVLYVKHNSGARSNGVNWNYSRTSLNADGLFVASAINLALEDEIMWPNAARRVQLGGRL